MEPEEYRERGERWAPPCSAGTGAGRPPLDSGGVVGPEQTSSLRVGFHKILPEEGMWDPRI